MDTSTNGPLNWPDYDEQRRRAAQKSTVDESVLVGCGWFGDNAAVLIVFEFGFFGGSIGEVAGQRVVSAFQRAREWRLPVVSLVASGGSRVQEGIRALSQLQAIAHACVLTRRSGVPHITVLRDPTTGGMWASLAASADLVLASSEAAVAFGGSRVRADGDSGFPFTAEGKYAAGQVDQLVEDADLPEVLTRAVELLRPRRCARHPAELPGGESPVSAEELASTGWQAVRRARSEERPRAGEYLDSYFGYWIESRGDRVGGTDHGMLCGIGDHNGQTVAFAAQTGTRTTPAGFRAASRILRLANRLDLPVLTLVDTPGAANDADAERQGVGPAIAELFTTVAEVEVPVTTLVIGEGGSGGALALAAPGRTWITSDAYFAVIAPEAVVAILKRDPSETAEMAERLRVRPRDLLDLGFVRGVVRPIRRSAELSPDSE